MPYFPIEWPRLIRASQLRAGDFGYLVDRHHVGALIGTADDAAMAVFLRSSEQSYGTTLCSELEGPAHRILDFKYEIDPSSGEDFELVTSPIGKLIIKGDTLWIAARPKLGHTARYTLKMGYALVELGKVDHASDDAIAFAYSSWRIVKYDGEHKHVLHERPVP